MLYRLGLLVLQLGLAGQALAQPEPEPRLHRSVLQQSFVRQVQARQSCKSVGDCREAVELWCSGYRRADGDQDGIPCENVCRSKEQVDKIRAEIGC